MKEHWILSNAFSVSIWMTLCFLLFMIYTALIDFHVFEPPWQSWDKTHLVMVYSPFYCAVEFGVLLVSEPYIHGII